MAQALTMTSGRVGARGRALDGPRVGRETSGSEADHGTISDEVAHGRVVATGARLCSRVRRRASGERVGRVDLLAHAEPASAIDPLVHAGVALVTLGVVLAATCTPQTTSALAALLPLVSLAARALATAVVLVVLLAALPLIRLGVRALPRLLDSASRGRLWGRCFRSDLYRAGHSPRRRCATPRSGIGPRSRLESTVAAAPAAAVAAAPAAAVAAPAAGITPLQNIAVCSGGDLQATVDGSAVDRGTAAVPPAVVARPLGRGARHALCAAMARLMYTCPVLKRSGPTPVICCAGVMRCIASMSGGAMPSRPHSHCPS
jgi:hypothetical protein